MGFLWDPISLEILMGIVWVRGPIVGGVPENPTDLTKKKTSHRVGSHPLHRKFDLRKNARRGQVTGTWTWLDKSSNDTCHSKFWLFS